MRRKLAAIVWIVLGASLSLLPAQVGQQVQLDTELARQELEILKGVLETTLRFSGEESWSGQIESFYLYRQGAVFVVPLGLRVGGYGVDLLRLERLLDQAGKGSAYSGELLDSMYRRLEGIERALEELPALAPLPPPPPAPQPVAPPEPPEPPSGAVAPGEAPTSEEPSVAYVLPARSEAAAAAYAKALEGRVKAFEQSLNERKADLEKREQEARDRLVRLEVKLVEALAKYAGALTTVGDNEYITLILSSGTRFPIQLRREYGTGAKVLTISKQSILDYNAGRLSLEAFKQQVLAYEL